MSFLPLPDLLLVLAMAAVLATVHRKRDVKLLRLWIYGLAMIVVEGVARIVYLHPATSAQVHRFAHIAALDAYCAAGATFLQSAMGRLRYLRRGSVYIIGCTIPYIVLLTVYGSDYRSQSLFILLSAAGLIICLSLAVFLIKSPKDVLLHLVMWLPVLAFSAAAQYRLAVYFALFAIYAATAVAFFFALSRGGWGRTSVVIGFGVWSLCFLSHPWIATSHSNFALLAEKIWDLQKFVVTFGLLIATLEEAGAANEYDALHDTLTGLPNRRLFADRLQQDFARARRNRTRIALCAIDLDGFKQINDNWGHEAGDFLLREVATRLRKATREADTLSRSGGDEFCLLINDLKFPLDAGYDVNELMGSTSHWVKTLRASVEKEPCIFQLNGAEIHLNLRLSIGCAVYPDQVGDIEALSRMADTRMYEDKRSCGISGSARDPISQLDPSHQIVTLGQDRSPIPVAD